MRILHLRWPLLAGVLVVSTPAHGQPTVLASQDLTTAGTDCAVPTSCIVLPEVSLSGVPSLGVYVDVGVSGTFQFEATLDGASWFAVADDVSAETSVTADTARFFSNPGYRAFRVRASALSGAARVTFARGASGLRSTASLTADGALQDGTDPGIEATVRDYAGSNPLAVVLTDTDGAAYVASGGGGGGGASQTDNTALASVAGAGALYDTSPPSVTDGNVGAVRMSSDRYLYTVFPSAQSVALSGSVPAGTNNIGDVDVASLPALPTGANTIGGVNLAQYTPASGRLPVDGSGVTQPVSGTVSVTNFATLLADTDTMAGTLFTIDADTGNIVTAVQTIDNPVGSPTGGTAGTASFLAGGVYNATPPTLTNGQQAGVQLDTSGRVIVNCGAGCSGGGGTSDTDDGSIAGSQTVGLSAALIHVWNGSAWVRATSADATHGDAAFATGPQVMGVGSSAAPTAVDANDAVRAWYTLNGAQVVASVDPCQRYPKVHVPISQATSTQLFAGTASNRTFVCSVSIMQRGTSTQTWSLVSGTGTVCDTSAVGLIGGATAADGTDLSVTQGDGSSSFLKTDTDADNVCLLQSGTDRLNGWITYVVAPNQ